MGQITLPDEVGAKLRGLTERQELFDPRGNLLGYFTPAVGAWGPFSAEEVEAAFKQTGPARTLDEIIKDAGLA